jgi:outer membrane lipoprotein
MLGTNLFPITWISRKWPAVRRVSVKLIWKTAAGWTVSQKISCPALLLSGLSLFLLSNCAYPVSKELRQEARKDLTFPMVLENPTAYIGSIVLWGGRIIETIPQRDGSEIIVLETPLDYLEEPEAAKYSQGRFIAKDSKLLDPEVYKKGRKITLAGEIIGKETRPLGKARYTYPVVSIKEIHLWKRQRQYYPPPYYGWSAPWPFDWDWYARYGPYPWPYYYDEDWDDDRED